MLPGRKHIQTRFIHDDRYIEHGTGPGALTKSFKPGERRSVDVKHTGLMVDPTYGSPEVTVPNRMFKGGDLCLL